MPRSVAPFFAILSLIFLPILLGQAPAEPAPAEPAPPEGKFYSEGLHGVDLSGMTDEQKELALKVLNGTDCDCGCGMTVAQCRVEDQHCPRSPLLARAIVDAIRRGGDEAAARRAYEEARAAGAPSPSGTSARTEEIPVGASPVRGPVDAPVTIVEFSDFQSPFCGRAQPILNQILELYPEQVRLVFKNLPQSIHAHARAAARAAEAARRQGKFWEMHDKLFLNPTAMERADFIRHATDLGLDLARFEADLDSPEVAAEVDADLAEAERVGASSTPTFYVNGIRLRNAQLTTFRQAIERSLAVSAAG